VSKYQTKLLRIGFIREKNMKIFYNGNNRNINNYWKKLDKVSLINKKLFLKNKIQFKNKNQKLNMVVN
jgi:hypothetical protein